MYNRKQNHLDLWGTSPPPFPCKRENPGPGGLCSPGKQSQFILCETQGKPQLAMKYCKPYCWRIVGL